MATDEGKPARSTCACAVRAGRCGPRAVPRPHAAGGSHALAALACRQLDAAVDVPVAASVAHSIWMPRRSPAVVRARRSRPGGPPRSARPSSAYRSPDVRGSVPSTSKVQTCPKILPQASARQSEVSLRRVSAHCRPLRREGTEASLAETSLALAGTTSAALQGRSALGPGVRDAGAADRTRARRLG